MPGETIKIQANIEFLGQVTFQESPAVPETSSRGSTTPSIKNATVLVLSNAAPTNVTNFTGGTNNQSLSVVGDGQSTVINGANIATNTGANKLLLANRVYCFLLVGNLWMEYA